jgi:hypothetical protein
MESRTYLYLVVQEMQKCRTAVAGDAEEQLLSSGTRVAEKLIGERLR